MHRHFKRGIMEQNERIHIEIEILQKKIDLWIRKEHEIYYREAEKRINDKAIHFAQRWTYTDHQDLLSKLLIDVMVNYIAKEERLNTYEEDLIPKMERLAETAENLNSAVAKLRHETTPDEH